MRPQGYKRAYYMPIPITIFIKKRTFRVYIHNVIQESRL